MSWNDPDRIGALLAILRCWKPQHEIVALVPDVVIAELADLLDPANASRECQDRNGLSCSLCGPPDTNSGDATTNVRTVNAAETRA